MFHLYACTRPFRCVLGMQILLYFISVPLCHMHHNHEWLREYYLTLNEQLFTYYMARTSYSRCYDNAVRFILVQLPYLEFILVQLPYLEFYSASSMKLQSAGRHVAPLGHIVLVPIQTFLVLTYSLMLLA